MLLKDTKCYLIGAMDRTAHGKDWREQATEMFKPYGVSVFNPYKKPISKGGETLQDRDYREKLIQEERWDEVSQLMKEVVSIDLRMVDLSDFILAYIDMEQKPFGTAYELAIANIQKKPIIVVCPGGKKNLPRWLFGCIPHEFVFGSLADSFVYLDEVNRGLHQNSRWKLFQWSFKGP